MKGGGKQDADCSAFCKNRMEREERFRHYFEEENEKWISGAYKGSGYSYPVGAHRLRILKKAVENLDLEGKYVLDIGCGGGDISFFMAEKGAYVTGIDMSSAMLETANRRLQEFPENLRENIEFRYETFDGLLAHKENYRVYDVIIAFGLIGYLESDEIFFNTVKEFAHEGTYLFLSCRNRLFNVTSTSQYTVEEINAGTILPLIAEIDGLYHEKLSLQEVECFLEELKSAIKQAEEQLTAGISDEKKGMPFWGKNPADMPRQETPDGIKKTAESFGFEHHQFYGVHPHLLLPRFNVCLPPNIFNLLSDSLCVFEERDISLIWSSVFIGCFIKKGKALDE